MTPPSEPLIRRALIAYALEKTSKTTAERYTIAVASGLIAGESIMGVVVAALNNFVLKLP